MDVSWNTDIFLAVVFMYQAPFHTSLESFQVSVSSKTASLTSPYGMGSDVVTQFHSFIDSL